MPESFSKHKNIILFVGNGFTLNYTESNKIGLNASLPLAKFNSYEINYDYIWSKYPETKDQLITKKPSAFHDFDWLAKSIADNEKEKLNISTFITLSYSLFQTKLNDFIEADSSHLSKWQVYKWIITNQNRICGMVSLNYDLLLEKCLSNGGIAHFRPFTDEPENGILIAKPHGSIDFDLPGSFLISGDEESLILARWNHMFRGCNVNINSQGGVQHLIVLEKKLWTLPRLQHDIVLPSQKQDNYNLNWVKKSYEILKSSISNMNPDAIVIMGFSYSDADKEEFNDFVNGIPHGLCFYDFNIDENIQLKSFIEAQGHEYKFLGLELPA